MNNKKKQTKNYHLITIPNIITFIRMLGSVSLILFAIFNRLEWFIGVFILLSSTDWIDGKLATLLKQHTDFGAKLDSWADALLYTALFIGCLFFRYEILNKEAVWIFIAIITYIFSIILGLTRFKQWPSYHTHSAKISWIFAAIAGISILLNWSVIPLRIAMVMVSIANIESILITLILKSCHVNIPSVISLIVKSNKSISVTIGRSNKKTV